MKYIVYKSDSRISNTPMHSKHFDCFADAKYVFDKTVEKFKKTMHIGRLLEDKNKNFKYEFESGDIFELNLLTEE